MRRKLPALRLLLVLLAVCPPTAGAEPVSEVRRLLAEGDWPAALELARERATGAPGDPVALGELGAALLRAGRLSQAERLLGESGGAGADPLTLVTLARLRAARGRSEQAARLAARAAAAAPDDPEILYWAAHAAPSREQAVAWLERFGELAREADADRREAVRGTLELFRALGERRTWITERAPQRVELELDPLGKAGELQGLVIAARVEGRRRPLRLLLDSGSPGLVLVERHARKAGYQELAQETSFGGGGSQRHRVTRGLLPWIEFGGMRFRDALATTTRYEIEPLGRYAGVIGLSAFEGYRLTIDPSGQRLVLELAGPQEGSGSPYWDFAGQMLVEVTVGDREELFLLDTGASRTIVAAALVDRLGSVSEQGSTTLHGFGGAREGARMVRGVHLSFQGLRHEGGPLAAADLGLRSRLGGVEISGFFGLDLLGERRIVVDTVTRSVRLD